MALMTGMKRLQLVSCWNVGVDMLVRRARLNWPTMFSDQSNPFQQPAQVLTTPPYACCYQGANNFGPEGAGALAPALAQMTGLITLDLVRLP